MKVTAVKFTTIVLDGSAANTLSQHFSNSFTQFGKLSGPKNDQSDHENHDQLRHT